MKKFRIFLLLCVLALTIGTMAVACRKNPDNPTPGEQVKLTLVANDGSEATIEEIEKNQSYTLPTPTRSGYAFSGWYLKEDFSGDAVTEVKPDADLSVYAKWDKLYTLTLDPNGGTLSTTKLELKAGEKLADWLASLTPTKENYRFGMWLLAGEELGADAVMGSADMTLVARYQTKYYVHVFLQNETLDGYAETPEVKENYAYVGEEFTASEEISGYTVTDTADSVSKLVIADDAAKNVFRLYFNRNFYSLTFVSNFPDGSGEQRKTERLVYGIKTALPLVTFDMDGYFLEGWALSADGEVKYSSHLMDGHLYNGTAPAVEELTVDGDITLYAVWSKGYTDLFGGSDILYVSNMEKNTVYLCRADIYFKGILNKNVILFPDAGMEFPEGRLNSDGETFLFCDVSREEVAATLYEMGAGKGLNELIKVYLDRANGITYSVKKDEADTATSDSKGEFYFDEDGYMVATFTEGEMKGQKITFVLGNITVESQKRLAFQIRNESEIALGQILCFTVNGNRIVVNVDDNGNPVGDLTLNGFGVASYNKGGSTASFYYTYDAENRTITLMDSQGSVAGVLRLMEIDGKLGYMIYNASADVSYTLADGSVLKLDGIRTATYTKGGKTVSGFFSEKKSALGGTILSFTDADGVLHNFMITVTTKDVLVDPTNPDGDTKQEQVTTVEVLSAVYTEYYYKDVKGTYYAPLFVFDGKDYSTVTVYGYNQSKEFHKIAVGTMTYNSATDTYTFTLTDHIKLPEGVEVFNTPIDFSKLKSCILMLDSTATSYSIHFWLTYTDEVETVDNTMTYTGKDGDKLTIVAGLALYEADGKKSLGTCSVEDGLATVAFADRTLYFDLNDVIKSFVVYKTTTTVYYVVEKDGTINRQLYLVVNPKTGATYNVVTVDGETQTVKTYKGTFAETGRTSLTGFPIYVFVSEEEKEYTDEPAVRFEALARTASGKNYLFLYDKEYEGSFASANTKNGILKLDGFGFAATYTDDDGREIVGLYQKNGDNVQISMSEGTYNFLVQYGTCYLRSEEYGKTYLIADNQVFEGIYATLDGLGGATVFRMESDETGTDPKTINIDANATYTLKDGYILLTYKDGSTEHTLNCKVGSMKIGSNAYNAFHVLHEEVVHTYVNEDDWSVLLLNSDGTATKYLMDGKKETGTYSLITESLLYYVNDAATDAFIYVYDAEKGTATPRSYTSIAYYTKELESLLFSKYGFAIFNNNVRYYYTIDDDDNVTLFHLDETATDKNRYGYIEENFGKLSDIKEYNNKTYYKNDGFAISFVREEETKGLYPVLVDSKTELYAPIEKLTFAPSGSDEFSVSGTVVINGKNYSCNVVRKVTDGKTETYLTIGYFRFDITISYQGTGIGNCSESTYAVTGLSYVMTMPSYNYLYYLYYIYQMMGSSAASQFPNTYGTVTLCTEYGEDGKATSSYLNATFGENSKYLEIDGTRMAEVDHAELVSLGNNYYRATFKGKDNYTYSVILTRRVFSVFQTYGYSVYALLREETVEANDGYQVTVNRVIASDMNVSSGAYFSFGLSRDGEALNADNVMLNDGKLYYVVREKDENGKVTSTAYYQLDLKEKSSEIIGGEDKKEDQPLPVYESATVTKTEATTVYTADAGYYVDILPGNKVLLMAQRASKDVDGKPAYNSILIAECTYDAETGVYTLKATNDYTYTVKVTDGVATVTAEANAKEEA